MVSKKKVAKEVQGTDEPITLAVTTTDITIPVPVEPVGITEEEMEIIKEEVAEAAPEPQPVFVDASTRYLQLLDAAPPVPLIRTLQEATAFVDEYDRWKRRVKTETG